MEAVRAVTSMNGQKPFDIIFMDPPYGQGHERRILEALRDNTIADGDTLILIEALADTDFSYLEELGFMMKRDKRYGTNRHVFVRRSTFGQNSSISGKL
jgi:16S rRNA (guanine966-N2)-methyltransferase